RPRGPAGAAPHGARNPRPPKAGPRPVGRTTGAFAWISTEHVVRSSDARGCERAGPCGPDAVARPRQVETIRRSSPLAPEVEEVEPLIGSRQAIRLEALRVLLYQRVERLQSLGSWEQHSLGQGFGEDLVGSRPAPQRDHQHDRALQRVGKKERPLWKGRRPPEKGHTHDTGPRTAGHAITQNSDELASLDARLEVEYGFGISWVRLD